MSTTDQLIRDVPAPDDLAAAHQAQLARLLGAHDRLVTVMESTAMSDKDRRECEVVRDMVETEVEYHFPDAFAECLPKWLTDETRQPAAEPDCHICRDISTGNAQRLS